MRVPSGPVNAESHNTTGSESSTHFCHAFLFLFCYQNLSIYTNGGTGAAGEHKYKCHTTWRGERKEDLGSPLAAHSSPGMFSSVCMLPVMDSPDPCQVGSVLWLSQIFCNPLLKTTKRVSAPGLTAPWQTAGAHNPAQAMQETARVQ